MNIITSIVFGLLALNYIVADILEYSDEHLGIILLCVVCIKLFDIYELLVEDDE